MSNTASLKNEYKERIVPALIEQFGYQSRMQVPVLKKIVINQGLGMATADKKIRSRRRTSLTSSFVRRCLSVLWLPCAASRCTSSSSV